jgi:hypothetical protein
MLDLLFGDDGLDSIQLNDILTDNIPQPDLAIISGEQVSFVENVRYDTNETLYTATTNFFQNSNLRYSLMDDFNGLFTIDAITGRVTFTSPQNFDFENQPVNMQITIRVTHTNGMEDTQIVSFGVVDVSFPSGEFNIRWPNTNIDNDNAGYSGTNGNDLLRGGKGDDVPLPIARQ